MTLGPSQPERTDCLHAPGAARGCGIAVNDGRVAVRHADLTFGVVVPYMIRQPALGVPQLRAA
jgi:hypothetical protein